jgi:hypothetical protein
MIPILALLHDKIARFDPGTLFAEKGGWPHFDDLQKEKGTLMASFIAGNSGSDSNKLIQEHRGAEGSPNATYTTRAPATMGSEENLKARIYDLECQLGQREEEIIKLKKDISEESQRLKSELQAMGILLSAKEEQIRRCNTRSKRRIYFP